MQWTSLAKLGRELGHSGLEDVIEEFVDEELSQLADVCDGAISANQEHRPHTSTALAEARGREGGLSDVSDYSAAASTCQRQPTTSTTSARGDSHIVQGEVEVHCTAVNGACVGYETQPPEAAVRGPEVRQREVCVSARDVSATIPKLMEVKVEERMVDKCLANRELKGSQLDVYAKEFIPRGNSRGEQLSSTKGVDSSCPSLRAVKKGEGDDVSLCQEANVAQPCDISPSPRRTGIHLDGTVSGVKVNMLVDTGADPTVISLETLAKLPRKQRMAFQDSTSRLQVADGTDLCARGPVLCEVQVNGRIVVDAVYAAPIKDEAILGLETLAAMGMQLSVAGITVDVGRRPSRYRSPSSRQVRRVAVATDCEVPPHAEAVIPGVVRGKASTKCLMIGPRSGRYVRDSLCVGRTVAKTQGGQCAVRVLNPSDNVYRLKAGQVIAEGEEVEALPAGSVKEERKFGDANDLPEHVKQLFEDTVSKGVLDPVTTRGLKQLLFKHADLFARDDKDLGRTDLVQHDIDTGDARPIRQPPRRVPLALQPELDKEIAEMLDKGVIEPGQSPWASPLVLVRKKDGTIRVCTDYRLLNGVTKFDAYPLPRIDETLEALSGAKYFTTLDLISGYWQAGLTPEARLKSAFCVRSGLYLWNVMPFGLCNAPSTFERLMESVLHGLQWSTCLVYLDDVIIYGKDESELLQRMDIVFGRLRAAGLKLKPKKCRLFARRTDYLGHVISAEGISVSPEKVAAVRDWPVPETVTDVRSFLGTANYYRRFCKDFATIAAPLHRLTDKGAQFVWTEQCQEAFDSIKEMLCTAPTLAFPVPDAPLILDTDASLTGIGAVLSTIVDGQERVLGYASRSLSRTERNYCVTRRELLAVVHFVRHFRPYLYGRQFLVRTDHASLKWLFRFKEPEGQLARWLDVLNEYKFTIEHRAGKNHGNADGLSRQPCRQCGRTDDDPEEDSDQEAPRVRAIHLQPAYTEAQLADLQQQDDNIVPVYKAMETGERPTANDVTSWPATAKRYWQDWERLRMNNGVLRRAWFDNTGREVTQQLIVPKGLLNEVMKAAHDDRLAGHFAEKRTLARLRTQYYWIGMSADVRQWCRSCDVCCARRHAPSHPHHTLVQDPVSEPLQRIAIDILGPLDPATARGNRYVLVVVDYLTKWSEAYPLANQTAETVAAILVEQFICRYGIPEQLHSDQGRNFESAIFTEMCSLLGIKKTRTTPLHPQSDGQTERMNRTLLDVLSKLVRENKSDWDQLLCYAMASYRSSVHSTTGETPNRLMLGREVATPLTLLAPPPPTTQPKADWVAELHRRFGEAYSTVLEATRQAHRGQKAVYDKRAKVFSFTEGDTVWLYDPKPKRGISPKLDANRWSGPYLVAKKISSAVYLVKREGAQKGRVVNVDRLAPYVRRDGDRFPVAPAEDDQTVHLTDTIPAVASTDVREDEGASAQVSRSHYRHEPVVDDVIPQSPVAPTVEHSEEQVTRPLPLTSRARRQARRPKWYGDFCD